MNHTSKGRGLQRSLGVALVVAVFGAPLSARANPHDISLRGVGRPLDSQSLTDPAVRRYRLLANELAVALAPRPLSPAETLGINGFEFSLVSSHTPINAQEDYWQGQPGSPVFKGVARNHAIPTSLWTPTAHLRKGLPMSMEIGVSGTYLASSEMFTLGAEYKISWHESFFRYVPAIASRFAFSRLFGSSDLDIITGEVDGIMSLPFGVGGMVQITPYGGYGQLFVHINSQVIDETPYTVGDVKDQLGGQDGSLYNFPTIEWNTNSHGRVFFGLRIVAAFVEVLYEFDLILVSGEGAKTMTTHSIKLGFDV